ncbi:hypothetical protein ETAA8_42330 [Anatilimnocola aggregata]|uniref:Secreted protein n=1 Tax=Anatilimnocola aggregata TaxID=2528021 RepID=A0A517YFX2_9BACT|nr:hypothetical protein [Anatilimnocola aggregata]QDU29126.1 hypothetical protein ETAA8_42330 [Anatilimnocola aggregata]
MHCLKIAFGVFFAALLACSSGCTMCCAPFDCDFGYTGGAWVRDNPSWGRVGSVFEPAGYKATGDAVTETATEPTPAQPDNAPQAIPEMEEATSVPRRNQTHMTGTPKLRRVDEYLPQE